MQVKDVYQAIDAFAPFAQACSWDNPGILVGDPKAEVKRAYVCLDVTPATVDAAIAAGCDLIVSHHPVIFCPLKKVLADDYNGALVLKLAKHDISVVSAHTNFDVAAEGVNFYLANALGLEGVHRLDPNDPDDPVFIGTLPQPLSGAELVELVKKTLGIGALAAAGLQANKLYTTISCCGGAGSDYWPQAKAGGAEVLISADPKHNIGIEAAAAGMAILDCGHYHTENPSMQLMYDKLTQACPDIEFILSDIDTCPWQHY